MQRFKKDWQTHDDEFFFLFLDMSSVTKGHLFNRNLARVEQNRVLSHFSLANAFMPTPLVVNSFIKAYKVD